MTPTQDDLLEFSRLVRWLTGRTLTQTDAAVELAFLRAKYAPAVDAPDESDFEGFPIPGLSWSGAHDAETLS